MIWIFSSDRAHRRSYEDFDDLFRYISDLEKLKLQENHPEYGQIPWSFILFTTQRVSAIYNNTQKSLITEIVKEAYEKEVGFFEICQGDFKNPIEILATSDLDIEALKRQWCLEYCNAHHYIIVETLSQSWYPEQSQWGFAALNPYAAPSQIVIGTIEKPSELLSDTSIDEFDNNLYQTVLPEQTVNLAFQEYLIEYPLSAH